MDPNEWGPDTWKFLHILSIKSQASQTVLHEFFYNLKYLLPCATCRRNYDIHFNAIEFPTHKKDIAGWLIKIHNRVNQSHENEAQMHEFWKKQSKIIHHSIEIGIWTFINCSVLTHPGKYKMNVEQINAHVFFWKYLPELLPNTLEDYQEICKYIEAHPFKNEVVVAKGNYHKHVGKFFQRFNLSHKEIKLCKNECSIIPALT